MAIQYYKPETTNVDGYNDPQDKSVRANQKLQNNTFAFANYVFCFKTGCNLNTQLDLNFNTIKNC